MARTERPQLSGCAPGVCGAAAVVVLTGRDGDAPDDSTVNNGAAQPLRQEQPQQRTGSALAPPGSTGGSTPRSRTPKATAPRPPRSVSPPLSSWASSARRRTSTRSGDRALTTRRVVREQHGHAPHLTVRAAQQEDPGALQALIDRLHGASGRERSPHDRTQR